MYGITAFFLLFFAIMIFCWIGIKFIDSTATKIKKIQDKVKLGIDDINDNDIVQLDEEEKELVNKMRKEKEMMKKLGKKEIVLDD